MRKLGKKMKPKKAKPKSYKKSKSNKMGYGKKKY
tara:strand:+ start:180 stop:281 length:102 start_codon:yes stop_codon:yes gene_type:complete